MTATAEETTQHRLYRSSEDRLLAGVASGLAHHLEIDTVVVRLALVALGVAGIGIAGYIALMLLVPTSDQTDPAPDPGSRSGPDRPGTPDATTDAQRPPVRNVGQLLAYGGLAAILVILLAVFGGAFDPLLWLLVFATVGAAVLWRYADPAERDRWVSSGRLHGRRELIRAGAGVVLIVVGVVGFLAFREELTEARQGLSATLAALLGIALVTLPWIVGLIRERDRERQERIRNQERAELAAHIHDSVLHTLTLIQRRADDPREVQRLARVQERSLRNWLYQRPSDDDSTLRPSLEGLAAEVEEEHGVAFEVVCVGDCPLDNAVAATLRAAREAMVNAAKYADVDTVSVFAEAEEDELLVFVRDRGVGFDPDTIPADRMGLRGSILDRMERHGGSARIRSAPGQGTEIQLRMPRGTPEE
ncbi:PspC domain-containing protein [Lipingzhangella sp. LS1_29]|uniref:PspC domain-containing protein n=1 Tax=Lipingzhangella rawalii TaxID=2055835 RepID=A0ABU2H3H8_9ACTN|nr:PspC domain-containing protein [Lipingzhangella rawalii]MDS1269858.1 PspC domain-containing protein [Lipingzhangella rawalii]